MQQQFRKYLLISFLAFLVVPGHGQRWGYAPGYMINNEGETIEGWVKDRSRGFTIHLYKKIRFQTDGAILLKRYGPRDILGYGKNDQHFESLPLTEITSFFKFRYYLHGGSDRVFLKIIAGTGELTYYHWEYVDGDSDYLDYIPLFHRYGSDEMVRASQGLLGLKKNRLKEYFYDCPELVMAIERRALTEAHEVYNFYIDRCAEGNDNTVTPE